MKKVNYRLLNNHVIKYEKDLDFWDKLLIASVVMAFVFVAISLFL